MILQSIQYNWVTWCILFIVVAKLSYPNIKFGFISICAIIYQSYLFHYFSHRFTTILTIAHLYHHAHSNLLSLWAQLMAELCCNLIPLFYLNTWIVLFYALFYSMIHHINYSFLQVNKIHMDHHTHVSTNLGPDICDIMFKTKQSCEIEDISHYIPVILLCYGIVGAIQKCPFKKWVHYLGASLVGGIAISYLGTSLYLWKKYDVKTSLFNF